jgi:hypothetical protein
MDIVGPARVPAIARRSNASVNIRGMSAEMFLN